MLDIIVYSPESKKAEIQSEASTFASDYNELAKRVNDHCKLVLMEMGTTHLI